jgi:CheY-like chemotaxis protein
LVQRVDAPAVDAAAHDSVDDDGLEGALVFEAQAPTTAVLLPESVPLLETLQKRVLVVGIARDLFARIEPLLSRASLAVDRVPRAESALALCRQRQFDLVIAFDPLPDMPVPAFVHQLRVHGSRCASAQVLLLTDQTNLEGLTASVQDGPNVVLPIEGPARLIEEIATRTLGVEPRRCERLMVKLEVQVDGARRLVMCQTENISKVGMLLRSEQPFPIGTKLAFELSPPNSRNAIQGEAEVVRQSVPDVEQVVGIGVRLLRFRADGRERWEEFLKKS